MHALCLETCRARLPATSAPAFFPGAFAHDQPRPRHRSRQARSPRRGRHQGRPAAGAGARPAADGAGHRARPRAAHHRACLPGRRRAGDHALQRRRSGAVALPSCPGAELRPGRGLALRGHGQGLCGWGGAAGGARRQSDAALRGGSGRRWRAPTAPIRSPTGRRSRRSPSSTSTGISSPTRRRPGRGRCFPARRAQPPSAKLAEAIFAASRVDGDDPIAAWKNHNASLHARTDMAQRAGLPCAALYRPGHRPDCRPRRRPQVERRRRDRQERHYLQSPTSRRRRCSPPPTPGASTARCGAPSRFPIRAR